MTDTPSETVSMSKGTRPGRPGSPASRPVRPVRPPAAKVPVPKMVNIVNAAMGVIVLGYLVGALLLLGHQAALQRYVISANAKAKTPTDPLDAVHAVYVLRQGQLLNALLFGVVFILLAVSLRRSRSASPTRWAVLVIIIITGMPFSVIPQHGLPVGNQITSVVTGLAAIATILLIFIPPSSATYFRRCREENLPEEMRGRQKPGLGSLFGPKPPRGTATAGRAPARAAGSAGTTSTSATDQRPSSAKAKAKVRADSDAVAKGADLARSRAKATKSRRTAD